MSTKTSWGITTTMSILNNDVTIKSTSENPKKFTLERFEVSKEKLKLAFSDLGISLPDELLQAIPSESTEIRNLVIDGSKTPKEVAFEIATTFSEDFILNQFENFLTVKSTSLYFKIAEKE